MTRPPRFSEWPARWLLRSYPRSFRLRYGGEMIAFFRLQRGERQYEGRLGGLRFWREVLFDVVQGALKLRWRRLGRPGRPSSQGVNGRRGQPPAFRTETEMGNILQDIRISLRTLFKHPGWTAAAVLTLAIGIGATSAIFGLVNDILLRPLPYPQPERIIAVGAFVPEQAYERRWVSYPVYSIFRESQDFLEELGAFSDSRVTVDLGGGAERMSSVALSASVLEALGVQPALGRPFQPADDEEGAPLTVLLSHRLWSERMGGDPGTLGRSIEIGERPHSIIGVMPRGFSFGAEDVDFWLSLARQPRRATNHYLKMVGRLKDELSIAQAQARGSATRRQIPTGAPGKFSEAVMRCRTLQSEMVGNVRPQLLIFLGAVGAVLLIGSINVVNLMLTRSASRGRELALRSALGAGRLRLARQLLTEALLLGLIGGLVGAGLAYLLSEVLIALAPGGFPRSPQLGMDPSALAFTFGLALLTGLAVGALPALSHSRPDLEGGLREGARGAGLSPRRNRLRNSLVVAQVAMALVLVTSAGLLVKSFMTLSAVSPGFDTRHLLSFRPALSSAYADEERRKAFYQELVQRLESHPGIESAAITATPPVGGGHIGEGFAILSRPLPAEGENRPGADVQIVGPKFLETAGIPVLKGRGFDPRGRSDGPAEVLVSEEFVRRHFPEEDPLGERLSVGSYGRQREVRIVGVVPDVRVYRLSREPRPMIWEAASHSWSRTWALSILLRVPEGDPADLGPSVREMVREIDADVPLTSMGAIDQRIRLSLAGARFRTLLLGAFGATALLLSMVGVYGVMAYGVVQRTQEVGVRMAMGASRRQILAWFARRGALLTALGLALGLAGAVLATGMLESYLFRMTPLDAQTFALALLALAGAALLSCWLPARRASRLEPMSALRCE